MTLHGRGGQTMSASYRFSPPQPRLIVQFSYIISVIEFLFAILRLTLLLLAVTRHLPPTSTCPFKRIRCS